MGLCYSMLHPFVKGEGVPFINQGYPRSWYSISVWFLTAVVETIKGNGRATPSGALPAVVPPEEEWGWQPI